MHLYPRLHILSVAGLEADQIQDIIGEREDSIQFTAYGLPRRGVFRSSIVHFGHYPNLEQASLPSANYRPEDDELCFWLGCVTSSGRQARFYIFRP